jgi:hypothetical protein
MELLLRETQREHLRIADRLQVPANGLDLPDERPTRPCHPDRIVLARGEEQGGVDAETVEGLPRAELTGPGALVRTEE